MFLYKGWIKLTLNKLKDEIVYFIVFNKPDIYAATLMVFFVYRIITVIFLISLPLHPSFNLEDFLLDFNSSIGNIFMNDILTCCLDNDSETIHEDSDDESETIHGGSDDESEAIILEDLRDSSLIVEVFIQQDERLLT